ncbi:MAG TPA: hypothetical protein VD793_06885 [Gemmatimonadales bacterium]|nr:hypothetical protein [Gemmatimonadales bacterium]
MSQPGGDWAGWRDAWQRAGPAPAPAAPATDLLRTTVRRDGRRLLWITVAEALGTVALLVAAWRVARDHPEPVHLAWTAGLSALLIAGWIFTVGNRRGVWAPYAETIEAFVALARERTRRRLRAVRFLLVLASANLALTAGVMGWWVKRTGGLPAHPADRVAYVGAVVLLAGVALAGTWYRRRVGAELERLEQLAAGLAREPAESEERTA